MSLHRITAGSGYDYLTRQVAAMDSTERGHVGLASYYTEKGEIPGRWIGSGVAGIVGLDAGDVVTAEQMQSLFGSGHHPLAVQRAAALAGNPNATEQDMLDAIRLGQPFKVYANDISPYRVEVARRLKALNKANGRPTKAASSIEDRARIRTEVGLEFFRREFGRAPLDQRELAGPRRPALPPADHRRRRLRPHLLPRQVRLSALGARRSEDRRHHRDRPPGRRR